MSQEHVPGGLSNGAHSSGYDRIATAYDRLSFAQNIGPIVALQENDLVMCAADFDGLHPLNQATRGYTLGDIGLATMLDILERDLPGLIEKAKIGRTRQHLGAYRLGTDEVIAVATGQFGLNNGSLTTLTALVNHTFHKTFQERVGIYREHYRLQHPDMSHSERQLYEASDLAHIYRSAGRIGVSMGLAFSRPGKTTEDIRQEAMQAMLLAKTERTKAYNKAHYNALARAALRGAGMIIEKITGESVERL